MTFGTRLAELRRDKGFKTRTAFAEELGIPSTTLRNYEEDSREPGHTFIKKIAEYFDVSSDYLLCLTDVPEPQKTFELVRSEKVLVEKYRALDEHGKKIVDMVLDEEHSRMMQAEQSEKAEADYLLPIAAHKHEGATPEELAEDVDMVENDKI
jgi:repressor LexA